MEPFKGRLMPKEDFHLLSSSRVSELGLKTRAAVGKATDVRSRVVFCAVSASAIMPGGAGGRVKEVPMRSWVRTWAVGLVWCVVLAAVSTAGAQVRGVPGWDRDAATDYLDSRQAWWMDWPTAARDHGTFCVSCHTATPYALGRTELRSPSSPGLVEQRLLTNVERRVMAWNEIEPFYSDEQFRPGKTAEARGSEAILNALILANRDATAGSFSEITRQAFDNLWALQVTSGPTEGAWPWLDFQLEPWETAAAQYYGAALAAIAVGVVPEHYAVVPENRTRVARLGKYLQSNADSQHLFNRLTALWASATLPDTLTSEQRWAIVDETMCIQREDGGWSLASLGMFERRDATPLDTESDGYATGIVTYVLQLSGLVIGDPRVDRGLVWLRTNQAEDGSWPASSLNFDREPTSDRGRFMRDAATAYAVLALTRAERGEREAAARR